MIIYELDRKYLRERYKNNIKAMITYNDCLVWDTNDTERIIHAFGSMENFEKHIPLNKQYCIFLEA